MRRVLLIAFSFPPVERSGARRPAALAKYLPRFGWEVVVLTPKSGGAARNSKLVIETDYRDVIATWKARLRLDGQRGLHDQLRLTLSSQPGNDKVHTLVISFIRNLLTYPDPNKGWVPYALNAVEEVRRQNRRMDAMITTYPPVSCHLIGEKAKQILGCPWIADFRDLWTQDITTARTRDLRFLQVWLEKATLRRADRLVTVSDPWADRLRKRYPSKDVCAIPNGFDPDDFSSRPELTRKFTITHAGVLHDCRRDPTVLFEVLHGLMREKLIPPDDFQVRFYGPVEPAVAPLIQRYGLEQVVELKGVIPRREVLQREMESQLLLLLSWTHPNDTGLHTGKLFEYLGAARPILGIGGIRGALAQVLEETRAGVHVSSKEEVRSSLVNAYSEYKRLGNVPYRGDANAVSRYSHVEMARRFAEALDKTVGATAGTLSLTGASTVVSHK